MPESIFQSLLNLPVVSRIRRNHGLEHATLHILAEQNPNLALVGHSTTSGFRILGEISTETLNAAVFQALERLRSGERRLAVHPNCGTNFVVAGTFAGLAGAAAMTGAGKRPWDKVERLPLAASLATLALILARPLEFLVQERITTSGEPGALEVTSITSTRSGQMLVHQVLTRG